MSARSEDALDKMLPGIPERPELLVGHERWYLERLKGQFGFDRADFCVQSAWMEETPPDLPDFDGELRFLGPEWAETVYHAYSHAFGGVAYIRGPLSGGCWASSRMGRWRASWASTTRGPSVCWRSCRPTDAGGVRRGAPPGGGEPGNGAGKVPPSGRFSTAIRPRWPSRKKWA